MGSIHSVQVNVALPHASHIETLSSSIKETLACKTSLLSKIQTIIKHIFDDLKKRIERISLMPFIVSVNKIGTDVEKIFNIVSCLPIIGVLMGELRMIVGKLQIIAGLSLAAIAEVGMMVEGYKKEESPLLYKWKILSNLGLEHMIHGCLNVVDGLAVGLISTYTMGLGNVALLIPGTANKREFKPYFAYGTLTSGKMEQSVETKEKEKREAVSTASMTAVASTNTTPVKGKKGHVAHESPKTKEVYASPRRISLAAVIAMETPPKK